MEIERGFFDVRRNVSFCSLRLDVTILPVVSRELRVAARRGKTYWLRVAAALAALVVVWWLCYALSDRQQTVSLGKQVFTSLSVLAFAYCLLVAPFMTADCVSEEKREGTLGLLFLTELRSLDVVLGKWLAASLTAFYGLLGILPVLGIPLLMGGVTPGEYGRTALAVVNAIFFALTAGMCVSTHSRDHSRAVLGSVVLVLGLSGLVPGLFLVAESGFFSRPIGQYPVVAFISPAYTGYLALDAHYKAAPQNYWASLGMVHLLSWCFMVTTALVMPRVWREDPREESSWPRWLMRLGYTSGWKRTYLRRLDHNPILALAARVRWPHFVFWTLVGLVAINVFWITFGYRRNLSSYQFHQYFSHALVFTNRVWITVMACRFFLEARRTGALELMLTTPLPVRTILRGHWRALRSFFVLPIFAIALLHVFYVAANYRLANTQSNVGGLLFGSYIMAAGSSLINFLTDVLALCYVGSWFSLSTRKPGFAALYTFALVILGPWTIGNYLPSLSSVLPTGVVMRLSASTFLRGVFGTGFAYYPLGRTMLWVTKNVLLIIWARNRLWRNFRSAAAQTYRYDRPRLFRAALGILTKPGQIQAIGLKSARPLT